MPLRLLWYILRDLLKILALSTGVILTFLAFGVAIKPLSDGVLSPIQLARFILLSLPAMLQFALPFAAALSATLVYHRMTADNEITACAAGGVSYGMLLAPAALLGGVLTVGLLVVANYISPFFWAAMDRAVRVDAADYLITSIQKGEPVVAGDTLIDARRIGRYERPMDQNSYASLWMEEVIVVSLTKGEAQWDATARQATLDLARDSAAGGGFTYIDAWLGDAVVYDARTSSLWWQDEFYRGNIAVPESFRDTPKFMDAGRMRAVEKRPETYWRIAQRISDLRSWIIRQQAREEMEAQIRRTGTIEFISKRRLNAGDEAFRRYVLSAGGLSGDVNSVWKVAPPEGGRESGAGAGGGCRILVYEGGKIIREYSAASVTIEPNPIRSGAEPTFEVASIDTVARDVGLPDSPQTQRSEVQLSGLMLNSRLAANLADQNYEQLCATAREMNDSQTLDRYTTAVTQEIAKVRNEILSRRNDRAALSVSCLIMMLLGSCLAIFMRNSLPLTVYFCAFVPAIVGLVVISAGVDLTKNPALPDVWGLMLLWSGNAAMALLTGFVLSRVVKH